MSVLRTAPWRRAPLLVLRHPAVLLAVAGTCALLAMAAASGPLFLSSVGAASLQGRVAEQCPEADRPAVSAPPGRVQGDTVRAAMAAAGLPAPYAVTGILVSAPFGVNTTGMDSSPLTKFAGRSGIKRRCDGFAEAGEDIAAGGVDGNVVGLLFGRDVPAAGLLEGGAGR